MYFHNFVIMSPWKKDVALYLNKFNFPSPKDALCQVWLKLAQWFVRRRWKCEQFTTTTTTTTTDNGQILIRKAHLSLRLRWAKNRDTVIQLKHLFDIYVYTRLKCKLFCTVSPLLFQHHIPPSSFQPFSLSPLKNFGSAPDAPTH